MKTTTCGLGFVVRQMVRLSPGRNGPSTFCPRVPLVLHCHQCGQPLCRVWLFVVTCLFLAVVVLVALVNGTLQSRIESVGSIFYLVVLVWALQKSQAGKL